MACLPTVPAPNGEAVTISGLLGSFQRALVFFISLNLQYPMTQAK
jgi:hypothetical protein